jgi:hypothetical protein
VIDASVYVRDVVVNGATRCGAGPGIRIDAVAPGLALCDEERFRLRVACSPIGFPQDAAIIADIVLFLGFDRSLAVTGELSLPMAYCINSL